MKWFEEFIVIRKRDLKSVSKIRCGAWVFDESRFGFALYGGWIFALVFLGLFVFSEIWHFGKTGETEKHYTEIVNALSCENDSLHAMIGKYESEKDFNSMCCETFASKTPKLSEKTLYEFIKQCNPWFPEIIMAQAKLESKNFKSEVYKRCNNLFGMFSPQSRKSFAENKYVCKGYAEYKDWRYGVLDRILWDYALFDRKPTLEEYLNKIKTVYNTETPDYIERLMTVVKQIEKEYN